LLAYSCASIYFIPTTILNKYITAGFFGMKWIRLLHKLFYAGVNIFIVLLQLDYLFGSRKPTMRMCIYYSLL